MVIMYPPPLTILKLHVCVVQVINHERDFTLWIYSWIVSTDANNIVERMFFLVSERQLTFLILPPCQIHWHDEKYQVCICYFSVLSGLYFIFGSSPLLPCYSQRPLNIPSTATTPLLGIGLTNCGRSHLPRDGGDSLLLSLLQVRGCWLSQKCLTEGIIFDLACFFNALAIG
jgi:hypothetical protein